VRLRSGFLFYSFLDGKELHGGAFQQAFSEVISLHGGFSPVFDAFHFCKFWLVGQDFSFPTARKYKHLIFNDLQTKISDIGTRCKVLSLKALRGGSAEGATEGNPHSFNPLIVRNLRKKQRSRHLSGLGV
jgi:hypothetical protein